MAEKVAALIKKPHAIISIGDPNSDPPKFASNEKRVGILSLQFCDLVGISEEIPVQEPGEYLRELQRDLFSDKQASEIVAFVENMKNSVKAILCHCDAGVSRSAAVGAVIELMLNGSSDRVFNDPRFVPNKYVYKKLLRVWQEKAKKSSRI